MPENWIRSTPGYLKQDGPHGELNLIGNYGAKSLAKAPCPISRRPDPTWDELLQLNRESYSEG